MCVGQAVCCCAVTPVIASLVQGFSWVSARAGEPALFLRVALGGRSLPVVCRGVVGAGGTARAESAVAASVASHYVLGANGVGAARPGARGSRVAASR